VINKYYLLGYGTGEEVGGVYPQTEGLPPGYDEDSPASMTNLSNWEFPAVDPDLRFELSPEAVLTNVVSPSNINASGLLVDREVRDILEEFHVMNHAFYEASLAANGIPYKYYWLHMVPPDHSGIDFSRSTFATFMMPLFRFGKKDVVKCRDEAEMHEHIDKDDRFGFDVLYLTSDFMKQQYDLFRFPRIGTSPPLIASDRLCDELTGRGITGLKIVPQDYVLF